MSELLSGNVQPQYDTDSGTNKVVDTQGDMGVSVQTTSSITDVEDFASHSTGRNVALPSHQLELEPEDDIVVETGGTIYEGDTITVGTLGNDEQAYLQRLLLNLRRKLAETPFDFTLESHHERDDIKMEIARLEATLAGEPLPEVTTID